MELVKRLCDAGIAKINFAGGEPTLVKWLPDLTRIASERGVVTSIVTNGIQAEEVIRETRGYLDWIAFSLDSSNPKTLKRIGRCKDGERSLELLLNAIEAARDYGLGIKLNTVVCSENMDESLLEWVKIIRPQRWKIFQVLSISGENEENIEDLMISRSAFNRFVDRHRSLESLGVQIIPENNDQMRGSYIMIDPSGRFFSNDTGEYTVSEPILDVGIANAYLGITNPVRKLRNRGGEWAWHQRSKPHKAFVRQLNRSLRTMEPMKCLN